MKFPAIDEKGIIFEVDAENESYLRVFEDKKFVADHPIMEILAAFQATDPPIMYKRETFRCDCQLKNMKISRINVTVYLHKDLKIEKANYIVTNYAMFFGSYGSREIDKDYQRMAR